MPPECQLFGTLGCHLCEVAEEVARAVADQTGAGLVLVDVDSDEALKAEYNDHVPVTFVDDVLLSYWHLDADALRAALG